jgi:tetratricopeptide (TPR) repeat protein
MFSEATSALGNAVQIAPENVEAHKLIILLQRKRNDLRAAVLACEAALRAIPDEPFLTYTLAGLNIDLARREVEDQRDYLQRALSLLEKTVAKEPEFAEAHHDLALLILNSFPERKDLFPQALRHARLATEKTSSPRNYDLLSWAYARNGRTDLARQALEEGLKLFPQDAGLKQRSRLFEERKP